MTAVGLTAILGQDWLAKVHSADEAFVTGTLGGVTHLTRIDGRTIDDGKPGKATDRASELYRQAVLASPH